MLDRSLYRLAAPALVMVLGLAACGGDTETPTSATSPPATPPPDLAGDYSVVWTLEVLRKSDGFQKEFTCFGSFTLLQGMPGESRAAIWGHARVSSGCPLEAHDLGGTVSTEQAVEFVTNGPRPPEGPCPGGKNVRFSGSVGYPRFGTCIGVTGVTTVTCPQFGEHQYTYRVTASRPEWQCGQIQPL